MNHARQVLSIGFAVATGLFFALSDTSKVPSFALIVGFVLLVLAFYQALNGLLVIGSWYGLLSVKATRRRLAGAISGVAGCVIALQSTGQLTKRDVLVLTPLAVGAYLYVYASRSGQRLQRTGN